MNLQSARIIATFLFTAAIILRLSVDSQSATNRVRPSLTPKLKSPVTSIDKVKNEDKLNSTNKQERSIRSNTTTTNHSSRLELIEDELPPDFYELPPEQLDLGMNATGRAPNPILNVVVLQNGQTIDNAINVHPGTPLEMIIYLDDKSAKVYGLLASYLKVQDDTFRQREEVIIQNGCSIDTYIFGNFELNPEDQSLHAKFRAFKFPESNFVRFVGTVNVCIKQCAKVNCQGNRKKRASLQQSNKDNRLVMTVSTVLRISNFPTENYKS